MNKPFDIQYLGSDGRWRHAITIYAKSAKEAMRIFRNSQEGQYHSEHGNKIRTRKGNPSKRRTLKRVGKSLAKYVRSQVKNPRVKLPAKWTNAKVRVDERGNVQVKVRPSSGGRVAKNVKSVKRAR